MENGIGEPACTPAKSRVLLECPEEITERTREGEVAAKSHAKCRGTPPPPASPRWSLLMTPVQSFCGRVLREGEKEERKGRVRRVLWGSEQCQTPSADVLDLAWKVAAPNSEVEAQALHPPLCSFVQPALKSLFDCL